MPINHSTPKPIQVAAAVVGNALEWYDSIVFGFLTVVIARLFFPAESQYASLLLSTATFGVGFSCARWAALCSDSMPITKAESPLCF
jgi:MHS family proline/betaine transporter-like MFS transporter